MAGARAPTAPTLVIGLGRQTGLTVAARIASDAGLTMRYGAASGSNLEVLITPTAAVHDPAGLVRRFETCVENLLRMENALERSAGTLGEVFDIYVVADLEDADCADALPSLLELLRRTLRGGFAASFPGTGGAGASRLRCILLLATPSLQHEKAAAARRSLVEVEDWERRLTPGTGLVTRCYLLPSLARSQLLDRAAQTQALHAWISFLAFADRSESADMQDLYAPVHSRGGFYSSFACAATVYPMERAVEYCAVRTARDLIETLADRTAKPAPSGRDGIQSTRLWSRPEHLAQLIDGEAVKRLRQSMGPPPSATHDAFALGLFEAPSAVLSRFDQRWLETEAVGVRSSGSASPESIRALGNAEDSIVESATAAIEAAVASATAPERCLEPIPVLWATLDDVARRLRKDAQAERETLKLGATPEDSGLETGEGAVQAWAQFNEAAGRLVSWPRALLSVGVASVIVSPFVAGLIAARSAASTVLGTGGSQLVGGGGAGQFNLANLAVAWGISVPVLLAPVLFIAFIAWSRAKQLLTGAEPGTLASELARRKGSDERRQRATDDLAPWLAARRLRVIERILAVVEGELAALSGLGRVLRTTARQLQDRLVDLGVAPATAKDDDDDVAGLFGPEHALRSWLLPPDTALNLLPRRDVRQDERLLGELLRAENLTAPGAGLPFTDPDAVVRFGRAAYGQVAAGSVFEWRDEEERLSDGIRRFVRRTAGRLEFGLGHESRLHLIDDPATFDERLLAPARAMSTVRSALARERPDGLRLSSVTGEFNELVLVKAVLGVPRKGVVGLGGP